MKITKMKSYNNAFRRMFHFDRYCSASGMFVNLDTPSFGEIIRISIIFMSFYLPFIWCSIHVFAVRH